MVRSNDDYDGGYNQEELEDVEEELLEKPSWLQAMPFWAVSAILHLILVLVILSIPQKERGAKTEEKVPVVMRPRVSKPPPYDPTLKRDIKKTPKLLDPKKIKDPIIQRKLDEVTTEIPKGTDLNNLSNVNLNSNLINDAIGTGGGAAGAYGNRYGKGSLVREGGSEGTEEAVRAALEWLRRHQSPDGSWKCRDFTEQCKTPCKNESKEYGDGRGFAEHDVGVTALAMLAFTGYGHTHRDGVHPEYVECLRKAVRYLISVQVKSADPTTNGRFGDDKATEWIYDHSIATMAMGELLVMSGDIITLKRPVEDAVKLCLLAQNDGFGWRYGIKPADNDTSVTGWMVLALKTAKNARLGIPREEFDRSFAGAVNWFDRATASSGKTGYMVPGDEGARLAAAFSDPYPYSKELSCMTAVAVLCRLFAGESRKTQSIRDGVKVLLAEPPRWQEKKGRSLSRINMYYWYYGSYAMFQFGGKEWLTWNEHMQKALLKSQRVGGDEDGSWDPIDEWGLAGGRVYSTAISAMTLEVFYRFLRAQEGEGF
jgi:hypothetical protein